MSKKTGTSKALAPKVSEPEAEKLESAAKAPEVTRKAPEPIPVISQPTQVQLESLPIAASFELNGIKYRVADKTRECVLCHSLRYFNEGPLITDKGWILDKVVSLATSTLVKPVK